MLKQLTAFAFFLLCFCGAYSNTITVTSNADSGPGSLREAINQANANSSTADTIVFAIADQTIAGRTIALASEVSFLNSNLVIDGTTQPGNPIGVTNAKIRITAAMGTILRQAFGIMNAHDIGIYGIHFHALGVRFDVGVAIGLYNASNISIGALGKGNYFTNVSLAVGNLYLNYGGRGLSSNISFKSNIVNLTEDGTAIHNYSAALNLTNVKNMEIGGNTDNEGNFIVGGGGGHSIHLSSDTFANLNFGYAKLLNNKFGCDITQTQRLFAGTVYFDENRYASYGKTDTTHIIIKGNSYDFVPQGGSSGGVISINLQPFVVIYNRKGFIDIKSNRINQLSPPSSVYYSNLNVAFSIGNCENGIIGGPNANDSNLIAGCFGPAISLGGNKNITVTKNSIWCNYSGIAAKSTVVGIPKVNIRTVSDYSVAGTSTLPNCNIEVFLNKSNCSDCQNGKTYLGSVPSDASGNWSFTSSVLLNGPVTATATSTTGATGEFAHPEYTQTTGYLVMHPTCNGRNGYIRGLRYVAGTRYYWLYYNNGGVDTLFTEDVENAAAGFYKFVVEQGPYCSVSYQVNLSDNSPKINAANKTVVQPSCGLNNGKILNHYLSGSYNKVYWKNAAGTIVSTSSDLYNAGPGQYNLVVLDTVYGCGDSTQFYTLTNQSGPSLDLDAVRITPAVCNSNGSITGITASNVTGSPFMVWVDSLNRVVGNSYNLLNLSAGKYRLKFKDAGGCDTIITNYFIVPNSGAIAVDTANITVKASNCSGPTGSIYGIKATGATQYQWTALTNNNTVANTPDAFNLPSGNYRLTLTNAYGCPLTLPPVFVPQTAFIPIGVTSVSSRPDLCFQNNGHIRITSFNKNAALYQFRWVDSATQQIMGRSTELTDLKAGTYYLYAKDTNQCESMIYTHVVTGTPFPVINAASVQVQNDHCELKQGSISSVQVGGLYGPATYSWYDENNHVVGSSPGLQKAGAGTYVLKVTDGGVCTVQSPPFTINNITNVIEPPVYNDLIVPRYSDAVLSPKTAAAGTYYLVGASGSSQQNSNGTFTFKNLSSDTSVYIAREYGSCTSTPVKVNIKVVDQSYFAIPTAFTPNGDGKNDQLRVRVIGYIQLSYFRIYNRWGQLVFETHQLNDGWNGIYNGQLQDTGTFVWVAEGKDIKGNKVSDRGSFVLIR